VTKRLEASNRSSDVDLWLVPNLNPDGAAAETRGNAHGVDLNRNFPWRWRHLTGAFLSGPAPLSEPESRIAARLIERIHPTLSIWFHQHLDVVDDSGPHKTLPRVFAAAAHMRVAILAHKPGSVVWWQSHCWPGATAFVVELPAGALRPLAITRLATAVRVTAARATATSEAMERVKSAARKSC
jgi:protein MpaA